MASTRPFGDSKSVKRGFIVLVTARLAPGHVQSKFLPAFRPLAAHVAQSEDGCSAYELSVSTEDPDRFIIYERYVNKDYFEQVHVQSESFKTWQKACEDAGVEWLEQSIKMYEEQDVGF
eukprot:GHUV01011517.1.p1 GENE.GHUV01011517.1~~GHUV01011517.1.p1  ORF type:complete len:119 (+),score=28.69 GHUV01011517.1:109-465(+)